MARQVTTVSLNAKIPGMIQIHDYKETLRREWEDFVLRANNGTLFHRQRFLDYHPKGRFDDRHLIIKDGHALKAVMPGLIKDEQGSKTLISYGGASCGGLVIAPGLGIADIHKICESVAGHWARQGIKRILITQPPLIYMKSPHQYIDFCWAKLGFTYLKREITAVIPLEFDCEDCIPAGFKQETRTALRKGQKAGIEVRQTDDLGEFYHILEKNLSQRHNVKPTHTLDELAKLKKLLPDDVIQFTAYQGKKALAGITVFVCNPRVMLAFYISHDQHYQELRPVNSVYYEAIRWGWANGYKYLDLGTFTLNMQPNWGLGKFKENFGARGFLRETFELRL
ncbi:MAG: GNAT family N-acetyltransferase [Candidatus Edwardsbacteria bacterium]|nr:GNAT family N-acetyltransferase [Candidatus Edwardsbacteria bacterium]